MPYQTLRKSFDVYDKMAQKYSKTPEICHIVEQKRLYTANVQNSELKVKSYLLGLGFQPNLKGYHLLGQLIADALNGDQILPLKYKGYPALAKRFDIDAASIEKDIQNAISSAWLRGDVTVLYEEFGETLDENKGKPTNKQFILTALEKLSRSASYAQ